jgi:hypothetical protein
MTSTMRFDRWQNSVGQAYGTVLQVVQAVKSDATIYNAMTSYTGAPTTANTFFVMSAAITPKFSNSKILVTTNISYVASGSTPGLVLFRDSTPIGIGDAASNRRRATTGTGLGSDTNQITGAGDISFLDSPNTFSATTYSIRIGSDNTQTAYVNRSATDTDGATGIRVISTITLMEIAQ